VDVGRCCSAKLHNRQLRCEFHRKQCDDDRQSHRTGRAVDKYGSACELGYHASGGIRVYSVERSDERIRCSEHTDLRCHMREHIDLRLEIGGSDYPDLYRVDVRRIVSRANVDQFGHINC